VLADQHHSIKPNAPSAPPQGMQIFWGRDNTVGKH